MKPDKEFDDFDDVLTEENRLKFEKYGDTPPIASSEELAEIGKKIAVIKKIRTIDEVWEPETEDNNLIYPDTSYLTDEELQKQSDEELEQLKKEIESGSRDY